MQDKPITPYQAAARLGISVHSVRRWCSEYQAHLSPGANPVKGASRKLSQRDVEVLQEVQRLRDSEGLNAAQISERLQSLVIPECTSIELSPVGQASSQQAVVPVVVVESLQAIETRLQALETKRDMVFIAVAAFVAGLIVGLAVWWF